MVLKLLPLSSFPGNDGLVIAQNITNALELSLKSVRIYAPYGSFKDRLLY